MTLKERYEERKMQAKEREFREILEFISKKLAMYHPVLIELDPKNNDLIVGDYIIDREYFFKILECKNFFDFNSEDGVREFKNQFLLYIYMKLKDAYIKAEGLYENQICIIY